MGGVLAEPKSELNFKVLSKLGVKRPPPHPIPPHHTDLAATLLRLRNGPAAGHHHLDLVVRLDESSPLGRVVRVDSVIDGFNVVVLGFWGGVWEWKGMGGKR